jgi:hypothetical protein
MVSKSSVEFWHQNNLWRMMAYPILYIVVLMVWRNLFWEQAEIPLGVLSKLGGGQCVLLVDMPARATAQIFFATMFIISIIEITDPSVINGVKPRYSDRQRIGYAVLHSFAWTSLSLGISKLFVDVVCHSWLPSQAS